MLSEDSVTPGSGHFVTVTDSPDPAVTLLIERNKSGCYWLHFAVRPKENRRKTRFLQM